MSVEQHVEAEHARLGCSSPLWRFCPGSVRENAKYPNISNPAAADGTASHLLLELCMVNGVRAEQYLGQVIGIGHPDSSGLMGWFVESDRVARVQMGLDYIFKRVEELKKTYSGCRVSVLSETKSVPGYIYNRSDWWGTCDISITATTQNNDFMYEYEIADYKDGRRYVSEVANTQLLDYLLGKISVYFAGREKQLSEPLLRTTIIQPKVSKPIRTYGTTMSELKKHGDIMYRAAIATDDPNAPLIPGKHCNHFCRHKTNCEAQSQSKIERGSIMDNNIVEKVETSLTTMPAVELAKILNAEEVLMAAIAKAKSEAIRRLKEGQPVDGWVMGTGRASSVWNEDKEIIAKKLKGMGLKKDEIAPPSLISPAQARKLEWTDQRRKNLENLISVVDGKPCLVKGVAVKKSVDNMFMGVGSTPELPIIPTNTTIPDFM